MQDPEEGLWTKRVVEGNLRSGLKCRAVSFHFQKTTKRYSFWFENLSYRVLSGWAIETRVWEHPISMYSNFELSYIILNCQICTVSRLCYRRLRLRLRSKYYSTQMSASGFIHRRKMKQAFFLTNFLHKLAHLFIFFLFHTVFNSLVLEA